MNGEVGSLEGPRGLPSHLKESYKYKPKERLRYHHKWRRTFILSSEAKRGLVANLRKKESCRSKGQLKEVTFLCFGMPKEPQPKKKTSQFL